MNVTPENSSLGRGGADSSIRMEDTLRLLAHVPVPDGLEERIHTALERRPRHSQVLEWPAALEPGTISGGSQWMRAAAAAAIVFAVAGGGWGVYLHVQHPAGRMTVTPMVQPVAAPGGFSSAGAMRTPQAVKGPVVAQRLNPDKAAKRKKTAHSAVPAEALQPAAAGSGAQAGK